MKRIFKVIVNLDLFHRISEVAQAGLKLLDAATSYSDIPRRTVALDAIRMLNRAGGDSIRVYHNISELGENSATDIPLSIEFKVKTQHNTAELCEPYALHIKTWAGLERDLKTLGKKFNQVSERAYPNVEHPSVFLSKKYQQFLVPVAQKVGSEQRLSLVRNLESDLEHFAQKGMLYDRVSTDFSYRGGANRNNGFVAICISYSNPSEDNVQQQKVILDCSSWDKLLVNLQSFSKQYIACYNEAYAGYSESDMHGLHHRLSHILLPHIGQVNAHVTSENLYQVSKPS